MAEQPPQVEPDLHCPKCGRFIGRMPRAKHWLFDAGCVRCAARGRLREYWTRDWPSGKEGD